MEAVCALGVLDGRVLGEGETATAWGELVGLSVVEAQADGTRALGVFVEEQDAH